MSEDEFDNIPDEFEGINWNDIPGLSGPSSSTVTAPAQTGADAEMPTISRRPSSVHSSHYSNEDDYEVNSSFLAELDAIEEEIAHRSAAPTDTSNAEASTSRTSLAGTPTLPQSVLPQQAESMPVAQTSPFFSPGTSPRDLQPLPSTPSRSPNTRRKIVEVVPPRLSLKRPSSQRPSPLANKKGKTKAGSNNTMQELLEGFEDEMTCPICCDILAAAHLGNPCGHTFCGGCGWKWIVKNKKGGCPVCRTELSSTMCMIPNISMDNTVEKHIKALASNGHAEWEPGGTRLKDWNTRKDQWRNTAAERGKEAQRRSTPTRSRAIVSFVNLGDFEEWLVSDDDGDGSYHEEDEGELAGAGIRSRRTRSSRRNRLGRGR